LNEIRILDSGHTFKCYFDHDSAPVPDEFESFLGQIFIVTAIFPDQVGLKAYRLSRVDDLKDMFSSADRRLGLGFVPPAQE
jgi:hypothetical protein